MVSSTLSQPISRRGWSITSLRKTRNFLCFSASTTSSHIGMEVWYGNIYTLYHKKRDPKVSFEGYLIFMKLIQWMEQSKQQELIRQPPGPKENYVHFSRASLPCPVQHG